MTSSVLSQKPHGQKITPAPHHIQGMGAGFVSDVMDLSLADLVAQVSNDDAVEYTQRLAKEE